MEDEEERSLYKTTSLVHYRPSVESYFEAMALKYRGEKLEVKESFDRDVQQIYRDRRSLELLDLYRI